MKKRCTKCNEEKSFFEFNFKNKEKGIRNTQCKTCSRKGVMNAYYKNRRHYLDYRSRRNKMLYRQAKIFIYIYFKQNPCVDCGIDDPRVLHFDHVRGEKSRAVSDLVRRYHSLKRVQEEIKKCDVRCANCHAIKTATDFGYYKLLEEIS